ncbi:hypothetical protein BG004_006970 [Podila humilis]|nr:hypothetical protein BG004_006970 [Podila humilis]
MSHLVSSSNSTSTASCAASAVDMHMQFLQSIPLIPVSPSPAIISSTLSDYTQPVTTTSTTAPKHASADIVIPTSDSPVFSQLMLACGQESETGSEEEEDDNDDDDDDDDVDDSENESSFDIASHPGSVRRRERKIRGGTYRVQRGGNDHYDHSLRSQILQANESFVGAMSLQEAQLAVARLQQFAAMQPTGLLQGTLHSLGVIEQELDALSSSSEQP